MDAFLARVDEKKLLIELRDVSVEKRSQFNVHARVLFVDSIASLRNLITMQRLHDDDTSAENQRFYIILPPEGSFGNLRILLSQIMHFCLLNFILNVNVLVESKDDKIIQAYSYEPFTPKYCRNFLPILTNTFVNGSLRYRDRRTFPKKLGNFWQCPLVTILSEEPPFVIFEDEQLSGIDGYYLNLLSEVMNFSINAILAEGGTGKTSPNGTVNGAFKMMSDGIGDLSLGGSFCSVHRNALFSSTTDYFTTYLRLIVKSPKPYSSLEILLLPFDGYTWFMLVIILMAKWIGKVFWRKSSFEAVDYQDSSVRFYILTWLFSSLVLQSSYEGSIFKFLHNSPSRELPSDLEEALDQGYKIIARSTYYTVLQQFTDFSDQFIFVDGPLQKLVKEFDRAEGKYALVTIGDLFYGNRSEESKYQDFITVKKPIVQNILCIYLPKFSFLTTELNRRIKQMKYFGHLKKFYDKPAKNGQSGKNTKKKRNNGRNADKMKLSQLSGAFQLLGVFVGLGVVVFVMEILSVRNKSLRSVLDVFH